MADRPEVSPCSPVDAATAMTHVRSIQTARLTLRPFTAEDAPAVYEYARHREVAATTATIPHPYSLEDAASWIERVQEHAAKGDVFNFGIALRASGQIIGAIDLRLEPENRAADLGYAIHPAHWNRGYVTEAARAVVEHGFEALNLNRIHAHHFAANPASGRIMEKIGMKREGVMIQRFCKWGVMHDTIHWAILRSEYEERKART